MIKHQMSINSFVCPFISVTIIAASYGISSIPAYSFTVPNNQYKYQPGTNPCTNTSVTSEASQAITTSLNYALQNIPATKQAKGKSSENTVNVPDINWSFTMPRFQVPEINGWFYTYGGGTYGGKTYSGSMGGGSYTASASSTPKLIGLNTGTATNSLSQSSCNYQAQTGYTSSGELTTDITWSSLQIELEVNAEGYLADYGTAYPVKATISNMKIQAPAKYTFASNNPQTADLTYLNFNQCTSSGQVENVEVIGSTSSNLESRVEDNLQKSVNAIGNRLCKLINSKVMPKLPLKIDI